MKRFFNSPWPLLISMLLGTIVALATSVSFIMENEIDASINKTAPSQLSNGEPQPQ